MHSSVGDRRTLRRATGPPWRSTLVRPSWMIRYAEMSSAGGSSPTRSRPTASSSRPAERNWDRSRSTSRRPSGRRVRRRCRASSSGSEHAEHPAHLDQPFPGGDLDAAQRVPGNLGTLVDDVVRHSCLHGDHAHRVGDDVVEIAGDPQALGADRPPLLLRLLLDQTAGFVGLLLGLAVGLVELVAAPGAAGLQVLSGQPRHCHGEEGADPRRRRRDSRRLQQERDNQSGHAAEVHHQRSASIRMQSNREHQRERRVARKRAVAAQRVPDQGQVRDHHRDAPGTDDGRRTGQRSRPPRGRRPASTPTGLRRAAGSRGRPPSRPTAGPPR